MGDDLKIKMLSSGSVKVVKHPDSAAAGAKGARPDFRRSLTTLADSILGVIEGDDPVLAQQKREMLAQVRQQLGIGVKPKAAKKATAKPKTSAKPKAAKKAAAKPKTAKPKVAKKAAKAKPVTKPKTAKPKRRTAAKPTAKN